VYGKPSSSNMMEALRPFGVVQVYRSITAYPSNAAEPLSSESWCLISPLSLIAANPEQV
jgi:hypothetical protein